MFGLSKLLVYLNVQINKAHKYFNFLKSADDGIQKVIKTMIERLLEIAKENPEGFTVRTTTLEHVTSGWVVAMKETQNSFGLDGLTKALDLALTVTGYIGGWEEGTKFYWDAVWVLQDEDEATRLGIENEQIAIFSIDQVRLKFL